MLFSYFQIWNVFVPICIEQEEDREIYCFKMFRLYGRSNGIFLVFRDWSIFHFLRFFSSIIFIFDLHCEYKTNHFFVCNWNLTATFFSYAAIFCYWFYVSLFFSVSSLLDLILSLGENFVGIVVDIEIIFFFSVYIQ